MKLKDAKTIFIDDNDVERIWMLNEIVWEKRRPTRITMTASTTAISWAHSYTLTAKLEDMDGNPVVGTTKLYRMPNDFNGTLDDLFVDDTYRFITRDTAIEDGEAIVRFSLQYQDIDTYKYYVRFLGTSKYQPSNTTQPITVEVQKDQAELHIVGTNNIYNTWRVGARLVGSRGNRIGSEPIYFTVDNAASSTEVQTNPYGGALLTIDGKTTNQTHKVKMVFKGNDKYKPVTIENNYKVLSSKSVSLKVQRASQTINDDITSCTNCTNRNNNTLQKWESKGSGEWQCGRQDCYCRMIGSNTGKWKQPSPLTFTFDDTEIIGNITSMRFTFSDAYNKGWTNGGYPSFNNTTIGFTYGNKNNPVTTTLQDGKPGKISYNTHTITLEGAYGERIWHNPDIDPEFPTTHLKVNVNYSANTSNETGILNIKDIIFIVAYIPQQPWIIEQE